MFFCTGRVESPTLKFLFEATRGLGALESRPSSAPRKIVALNKCPR